MGVSSMTIDIRCKNGGAVVTGFGIKPVADLDGSKTVEQRLSELGSRHPDQIIRILRHDYPSGIESLIRPTIIRPETWDKLLFEFEHAKS